MEIDKCESEDQKLDTLLLCGGYATRLSPISDFMPKALLPIGGRPIISHILDEIKYLTDRIVIATNEKFSDQFLYWLKNQDIQNLPNKISLIIEPTTNEGEKFGIVKAVSHAIEKENLHRNLLIFSTDVFREFSIKPFVEHFKKYKRPAILLRDLSEYGVLPGSEIKLQDFIYLNRKLEISRKRTLTCGVVACPAHVTKSVLEYSKITQNPDSLSSFLRLFGNTNDVDLITSSGKSYDIGTIEGYKTIFDVYEDKQLNLQSLKRTGNANDIKNHTKLKK